MKQKLFFTFLRITLAASHGSNFSQKQNSHKHGIRPKLLVVIGIHRNMLKTSHLCPGQPIEKPIRTIFTIFQIFLAPCLLIQKTQCQKRRHGINIVCDQPVQLSIKPPGQIIQILPLSRKPVIFPYPIKRHPLRPIPNFHIK